MELKDPQHRVSRRAVPMWTTVEAISAVIHLAIIWCIYVFVPVPDWALWLAIGLSVLAVLPVLVVPRVRQYVYRWELTDTGLASRTGLFTVSHRIAPFQRVQTVDTDAGPVMRMFGLVTVKVTTASSAGEVEIPALDRSVAQDLVRDLTARVEATEGDGT